MTERLSKLFIKDLLARTDIAELIAARVELKRAGSLLEGRCPFHMDATPSFIVTPSRATYHCFGCGAHGDAIGFLIAHDRLRFRDAVAELAEKLGMLVPITAGSVGDPPEISRPTASKLLETGDKERRAASLHRIWRESAPVNWNQPGPTTEYLIARGLGAITKDPPSDIRHHACLPYYEDGRKLDVFPAMVALVRDAVGKPVSWHRTYVTAGGAKAPVPSCKKLCRAITDCATRGAAIRLYPATHRLALGEGLETCLAIRIGTGWPVWSCISAGGMRNVQLSAAVTQVTIWADADPAGINASRQLADRLVREGRTVQVLIPEQNGADWLDVLVEGSRAAA